MHHRTEDTGQDVCCSGIHCFLTLSPILYSAFDEKDFVSGVQLLTDNYSAVLAGDAQLNGVTVTNVIAFKNGTLTS